MHYLAIPRIHPSPGSMLKRKALRKVKNVELASKFTASSEVYTAFVCREIKSSIELSFPDLELSFPFKGQKCCVQRVRGEQSPCSCIGNANVNSS